MATIIITMLGNDKAGLVDVLSGAIAARNGNWVRSHMTELEGKFAGVVEAAVPETEADALIADLGRVAAASGLTIVAERAERTGGAGTGERLALSLTGQDHPGIVHRVANILARHGISIDQLETEIVPAPQGGHLFRADAVIELPAGLRPEVIERDFEALSQDLMIDLESIDA